MRRHARSEKNRKIVRRIRERGEGGAAAEIGSRVFPFRTPPPAPASMPSVGTRRSTRVFVPKQQQQQQEKQRLSPGEKDPVRVLRSGKPFAPSGDDDDEDWINVLDGDESDLKSWRCDERSNGWRGGEKEGPDDKKLFGTVYSRKRRRSSTSSGSSFNIAEDRKFGIVFERRHRKKLQKVTPLVERTSIEDPIVENSPRTIVENSPRTTGLRVEEFSLAECSKNFAAKLGIFGYDICSGVECGPLVLAVLVDSSPGYSLGRFERFLISVIYCMRRARVRLGDLFAFLSSRSVAGVFSSNGIHFLPVWRPENGILDKNSISGCGVCKISGASKFIPLFSVDFSALPSFFKSLHAVIIHQSQYFPHLLRSKHLIASPENSLVVFSGGHNCDYPLEMEPSRTEVEVSETPAVKRDALQSTVDLPMSISQNLVLMNGSKFYKHQKKRSSLRNSRPRKISSVKSHFPSLRPNLNSSSLLALSTPKPDLVVNPVCVKQVDSCLSDLIITREESDNASPQHLSNLGKLNGMMSPEKVKDQRASLAGVRQNIDSISCHANILVTDTDRCWREDEAQVMLEMSGSHEWFIVVKRGEVTRFMCKPQDWKPCAVNRFNHAYMWCSDDGWKLEFCDKWDWNVFKELHVECRIRNSQDAPVKIIPVPGVREVSGYEEDAMPSFVRPEMYIRGMVDEVGRALASENSFYDMDRADEEWLRHLNSNSIGGEDDCSSISEENFERIICTFEKSAYNSPDDAFNKERALELCQGLGRKGMLSSIYDYWLKKRKQKKEPLARVFQGEQSRRRQLFQKPVLRKKRSFKRQRGQAECNQAEQPQVGRGKPYIFLKAQQDRHKWQAAEADAIKCIEIATTLRTKAQMLMLNADLAAYKAEMALKIAETIGISSLSSASLDMDSFVLLD